MLASALLPQIAGLHPALSTETTVDTLDRLRSRVHSLRLIPLMVIVHRQLYLPILYLQSREDSVVLTTNSVLPFCTFVLGHAARGTCSYHSPQEGPCVRGKDDSV